MRDWQPIANQPMAYLPMKPAVNRVEGMTMAIMAIVTAASQRGTLQDDDYRHLVESDVRAVIQAFLNET